MNPDKIKRRCYLPNAPEGRAADAVTAADSPARGVTALPQRPDVVVIGGGIAGLAAARRLKQEGASVVVLEARNRLGGRIHTQPLVRGGVIDLGAQFIGDAQRRITNLQNTVYLHSTHADYIQAQALQPAPPRTHVAVPNGGRALRDLA